MEEEEKEEEEEEEKEEKKEETSVYSLSAMSIVCFGPRCSR